MIRADAYGYACPGRPELAAELAWRDAGLTHRRTGIYGTHVRRRRDRHGVRRARSARGVRHRGALRPPAQPLPRVGADRSGRSGALDRLARRLPADQRPARTLRALPDPSGGGDARQHAALGGVGRPRHLHPGEPGQRHRLLRRDRRRHCSARGSVPATSTTAGWHRSTTRSARCSAAGTNRRSPGPPIGSPQLPRLTLRA